MKNRSDIVIILQGRDNSQRVKNKMTRPFADTTIWDIAAKKLELLNESYHCYFSICRDDAKLWDMTQLYRPPIFERSHQSANADNSLQSIYEWHDQLEFTYVILFNACLIFLSVDTIKQFIEDFIESESEGMFGVFRKNDYFWDIMGKTRVPFPPNCTILNTKAIEPTYQAAHSLYASRMDLIGNDLFMGDWDKNPPELVEVDEGECLDVDYEWQFDMLSKLYQSGWKA